MAPRRPVTRPRHRAAPQVNPAASGPPQKPTTKLAKRSDAHTRLLSSLHKSKPNTSHPLLSKTKARISKSSTRRAKRKQKAQLGGSSMADLATALEGMAEADDESVAVTASSDPRMKRVEDARKSIKTQPGAQRKKEKVGKMERERFKGNLQGMMGVASEGPQSRWEALRASIQSGMAMQ